MRVFVYRNLHKSLWSVKALDGEHKGKVVVHSTRVSLSGAEFKVSQKGRAKVIREGRKNVHAGVVGTLTGIGPCTVRWGGLPVGKVRSFDTITTLPAAIGVTYNPYKYRTFVVRETEEEIVNASLTFLDDHGKVYAYQLEQEHV